METSSNRKGRDLILALDTSGSMAERGFNRKNLNQTRYDISISLAKDFIKNRFDDNIGLVIFGSFAFTASPLTYDLKGLEEMFDLTSSVGVAGTSTAIGDAIWQSILTLNAGGAKSKVVILLTDGKHNAGVHSPREAVEEATKRGVKIYTIGIGKDGEYDRELLSTIAKKSGGKSFFASDSSELKEVYSSIESLEPSSIRSREYLNREEMFIYPTILATILLFILLMRNEEIE
jgi:Ca-activated chloride channel family protein